MTCRISHVARWLLVAALVVALCPVAWSQVAAPGAKEREIILAVTQLMQRRHLSGHPLDNEISERCFGLFLKGLDPRKVYFYQSDIDEFAKEKEALCDALRRADVSFAYKVFSVYLQRVDERVKMADEILGSPLDFTADDRIASPSNRDTMQYPRTAAEALERWRQQVKWDLLVLKATKQEEDEEAKTGGGASLDPKAAKGAATAKKPARGAVGKEALEKLGRHYHSLAKRMHQINGEELLELYLTAFTMSFDPHTDYMSPRHYKNFIIMMSLELEGIGAQLRPEDGYTVVQKIIPGGAADKDHRLKVEDKIIGVGQGDEGEMVDVIDMKLDDVVEMIRGKPNTTVRLEVVPADGSGQKVYKLAREKIELKDSEAQQRVFAVAPEPNGPLYRISDLKDGAAQQGEAKKGVFDAGRKANGSPYRVGVIRLLGFYRDMEAEKRGDPNFKSATRDVRAILDDFRSQGVDAVILDLRLNGGGSLLEAISLTGLFIHDGPVTQVKDADGRVAPLNNKDSSISWAGPLVVLTSRLSASASEILAGAIQDYHRGLIVGDPSTHGKGTVQNLHDLGMEVWRMPNAPAMGALKITIQQFYRPDGDSTQRRGVLADVELPSIIPYLADGESELDYPMAFDKVDPARYKPFDDVNPTLSEQLRKLSADRVQKSEKFQKEIQRIARYKEQKARKYDSLNEAKFIKERAGLTADKAEEKLIDDEDSNTIKRDYYLDEVMAIAGDYINLERQAKTQRQAAKASDW